MPVRRILDLNSPEEGRVPTNDEGAATEVSFANIDEGKEILRERISKMPTSLQQYVLAGQWAESARRRLSGTDLTEDQKTTIENELLLALVGLEPFTDLADNIEREAQIDPDKSPELWDIMADMLEEIDLATRTASENASTGGSSITNMSASVSMVGAALQSGGGGTALATQLPTWDLLPLHTLLVRRRPAASYTHPTQSEAPIGSKVASASLPSPPPIPVATSSASTNRDGYCQNCGARLEELATFCTGCGNRIS